MTRGQCAGEHEQTGQQCHEARGTDAAGELSYQLVGGLERLANADHGHIREGVGDDAFDVIFRLNGRVRRREEFVRGLFQHAWRDDHEEVHAGVREVHAARVGDAERELAAQDVHAHAVADVEPHAFGQVRVERQERRALVVVGPPRALDELVMGAGRIAIGEAAVAVERPLHFLLHFCLFNRHTLDLGDAATEHRHEGQIGGAGLDLDELAELLGLGGLDANEEEAWGFCRRFLADHAANVGVDQRNSGQQRQSEPQGQDDCRGGCAGAIDVGQRQSRHHDLGPRHVPREPHERPACCPQDREGCERARGEAGGEFDVGRQRHGKGCEHGKGDRRRHRIRPAGPAVCWRNKVAEHHGGRNVLRARQRPDGKGQSGQKAEDHGRSQRSQKEAELGVEREES